MNNSNVLSENEKLSHKLLEDEDEIQISDNKDNNEINKSLNNEIDKPEYHQIKNELIDNITDQEEYKNKEPEENNHKVNQSRSSKKSNNSISNKSEKSNKFNKSRSLSKSRSSSKSNSDKRNKSSDSEKKKSNKLKDVSNNNSYSESSNSDKRVKKHKSNNDKQISTTNQNNFDDILEYYEFLRNEFKKTGNQFKDYEFPEDPLLFYKDPDEKPEFLKNYTILFERIDEIGDDQPFFFTERGVNIEYDFKIQRGIVRDKFFIGSVLMLFRRREEFFSNLIIDIDNVKENIKAGFCGFRFFINGEWKDITIDTTIPMHLNDDTSLSLAVIGNKSGFWLTLFQKAYSKAMKSYDSLNDVSIKNTLVEFTGGISKKISVKDKADEVEKKKLFEDLRRMVSQKYLLGCMRFNENEEDHDDSRSEDEDEDIITNSVYVIIDVQEADGYKLVYLINYWNRGKWNKQFGQEDETWETNKALKAKLEYEAVLDLTFWMTFDDWMSHFNILYYCRIFPSTWSQYCLTGEWVDITSGGAPIKAGSLKTDLSKTILDKKSTINKSKITNKASNFNFNPSIFKKSTIRIPSENNNTIDEGNAQKKQSKLLQTSGSANVLNQIMEQTNSPSKDLKMIKEPDNLKIVRELQRRVVLNDSDDRWFLNPQYKVQIKPGIKLIISLMQENEKISKKMYEKVNFVIILTKGKYSRVWEYKEEDIIKKGIEIDQLKIPREMLVQLDYTEIKNKISQKKKKTHKIDRYYVNIIPYMEYSNKYEVEKQGNFRTFKHVKQEARFWLRIFSSDEIYVSELHKPYETSVNSVWASNSAGGARFVKNNDNMTVENAYWPINPQYLLKFDRNIQMKIILRKTTGLFTVEEDKVGLILTKPNLDDKNISLQQLLSKSKKYNKNDQLEKIIDNSKTILESKVIDYSKIQRKLAFYHHDWIVESSYSNNYTASLYMTFNKLDSPIMVIPTLAKEDSCFEYKLSIYSNKPVEMMSLDNEYNKVVVGEWNLTNAIGSHLALDDEKRKSYKKEDSNYNSNYKMGMKNKTYLDNPKYHLSFDTFETIPEVEFEIKISRSEGIWGKKIADNVVNTMVGVYIFKYHKEKWKELCINFNNIEFFPKNEMTLIVKLTKVNPEGFILMPTTYGKGIYGPFSMMIKSKEKINLKLFK